MSKIRNALFAKNLGTMETLPVSDFEFPPEMKLFVPKCAVEDFKEQFPWAEVYPVQCMEDNGLIDDKITSNKRLRFS